MRANCVFLMVFVCCLLTSCEDTTFPSGQTVVEGHVVDATSGEPVPRATLKIIASRSTMGAPIGGSRVKEKRITVDENGHFEHAFEHSDDLHYKLEAYNEGLYGTSGSESISKGEMNGALEVEAHPFCWINLEIINEPPKEKVERLHIRRFRKPSYFSFEPFEKDTSILVNRGRGGQERRVIWTVRKEGGEEERFTKEFFCPALDTTNFKITY